MTLTMIADVSLEELQASTLTICRNEECYPTGLTTLRFEGLASVQWPEPVGLNGKPRMEVHAEALAEVGIGMFVYYDARSEEDWKDGDVFQVILEAGDGRTLKRYRRTARYTMAQPNGPCCPPFCYRALFLETGDSTWPARKFQPG